MKTLVSFVLTLGIVGVIANPVSKQTIQSENKNSPQVESGDSQKHEEVINTLNKGDQEQKKDTPIENPETPNIDTSKDVNEKVEIIIEENIISPIDDGSQLSEDKCEQEQKKDTTIDNFVTPNIDTSKGVNEKVEIIIEENIISPIDDGPQLLGEFGGGSLLPGYNEDAPQLPGAIEDSPSSPQFPGLIGGGPHLPELIESSPQMPGYFAAGPQLPGDFAATPQLPGHFASGPQVPGFVEESPQMPSFIGDIPQLPEFIESDPQMPGFNDDGPQLPEVGEDDFLIDKDYFREDMQKIEHEIMETAAGFIPTPLVFRRKQKPTRRRFATRRHFRRNPYRRHQFFYPSYYTFYRPSSLRFY